MKRHHGLAMTLPLLAAPAFTPAFAADLAVKFTLPQLPVAEYHRPYVAIWVEKPDQTFVANLNVLYDLKKRDNAGTKWLKDMRQWWRKSGRELTMPVDGVSAATRAPGEREGERHLAGRGDGRGGREPRLFGLGEVDQRHRQRAGIGQRYPLAIGDVTLEGHTFGKRRSGRQQQRRDRDDEIEDTH